MKEHIANKKLEVVLRFLAGFSLSELGQDLWEVVRGFASEDIPSYSWLSAFGEAKSVKLQVLHWLFESQCFSAIPHIIGLGSVSFCNCTTSLLFDLYVLGYCIIHSSCDWKLELRHCKLESIETFLKALTLQQDQFLLPSKGQIKQIVLWRPDPTALNFLVANIPQILVFHNLTHLSLCDGQLTSQISNHLSEHTDLLKHLLHLDFHCNPIGRGGAVNLITSLSKFSIIRELDLTETGIGFEDCKALNELLASSKCIEVLDIGWNKLSSESINLIIDGFSVVSHNTSLEKLDMSHSNFSSENVLSLASVLRVNTRLKELSIGSCNIQSSDSVYLATALRENTATQLQALKLSGNPIRSEGAVAFASMIATNNSLANLHLSGCSIEGEGSVCFAGALEKSSTVKDLALSDNPIGSAGAVAFADMLTTNESLNKLHMNVCSIEGEGAHAFSSMLKRNRSLKMLWLSDDSIGVQAALTLIKSLQQNTTLEELWLSCKCKPPSFSTLDTALQKCVKFL